MRLLDTFCKAGGAGYGYKLAGFDVIGVDIEPQPNYPFKFHKADAIDFIRAHGKEFDIIHASPPCQKFSSITKTAGTQDSHPDLVEPTRRALIETGKPYIIENVPGAPLINPITLCGTMFGLDCVRHRLFETNPLIWFPPASCNHYKPVVKHGRKPDRSKHFHGFTGHFSDVQWAREITGCDWMNQEELAECIPPAYTEWIGKQIKEAMKHVCK